MRFEGWRVTPPVEDVETPRNLTRFVKIVIKAAILSASGLDILQEASAQRFFLTRQSIELDDHMTLRQGVSPFWNFVRPCAAIKMNARLIVGLPSVG